MRTTIRLDDQLFKSAKQLAHESGKTLTAIIEDALRQTLSRTRQQRKRSPVTLTTVGGSGLQPGVDLQNSEDLLTLMDDVHGTS
jgi:hypothetical protein